MEEGLRAKGLRWTDSAAAKFAAAVSDEARRKFMATEAEATSLAIPPKPAPLAVNAPSPCRSRSLNPSKSDFDNH